MDVLVAYGTIEGQSRKIAHHVAEAVRAAGHTAVLIDTEAPPAPIAPTVGAAILVAPVHVGKYPEGFEAAVQTWSERLAAMPAAFVSVSLAVADDAAGGMAEAEHYVATLTDRTGWRPVHVHHAAGALMFSEYDFFKRWMMRMIARTHDHSGTQDQEFTDWPALDRFVATFLADL